MADKIFTRPRQISTLHHRRHSFGVRAANVDGVLHLTGGWSDAGDSSLVMMMMMTKMMMIMTMMMMMIMIIMMMMMMRMMMMIMTTPMLMLLMNKFCKLSL